MKYLLFLRGINVGGKNTVSMDTLKRQLTNLGFLEVISYINSGNILFSSSEDQRIIHGKIQKLFQEQYSFVLYFSLLSEQEYRNDFNKLPKWWFQPMARKDVLFFTEEVNREMVKLALEKMTLHNEKIHIGENAVFWGKLDEKEFLKTAYHKYLIKQSFYKQITIRNENTYNKMLSLLDKK